MYEIKSVRELQGQKLLLNDGWLKALDPDYWLVSGDGWELIAICPDRNLAERVKNALMLERVAIELLK